MDRPPGLWRTRTQRTTWTARARSRIAHRFTQDRTRRPAELRPACGARIPYRTTVPAVAVGLTYCPECLED